MIHHLNFLISKNVVCSVIYFSDKKPIFAVPYTILLNELDKMNMSFVSDRLEVNYSNKLLKIELKNLLNFMYSLLCILEYNIEQRKLDEYRMREFSLIFYNDRKGSKPWRRMMESIIETLKKLHTSSNKQHLEAKSEFERLKCEGVKYLEEI